MIGSEEVSIWVERSIVGGMSFLAVLRFGGVDIGVTWVLESQGFLIIILK